MDITLLYVHKTIMFEKEKYLKVSKRLNINEKFLIIETLVFFPNSERLFKAQEHGIRIRAYRENI